MDHNSEPGITPVNMRSDTLRVIDLQPTGLGVWNLPDTLVSDYMETKRRLVSLEHQILDYLNESGQHIPYGFPGHAVLDVADPDFTIPVYNDTVQAMKHRAPSGLTWSDAGVHTETPVPVQKSPALKKVVKKATKKTAKRAAKKAAKR